MGKVAWIGLGVMGFPMAGHLKKGGHDVTVYNRTRAKADAWVAEYGGSARADAGRGRRRRRFRLRLRRQRRRSARGDARAPTAPFTAWARAPSSSITRRLRPKSRASCTRRPPSAALGFLDAPVSGGQAGAENGTLTVMVGGDEAAFARAKPVIETYARAVNLIGPSGSGQLTKMVNQISIAGLLQALAEAIAFRAERRPRSRAVIDTISKGAAQSWQMENRWKTDERGPLRFRLRRRLDAQGSRASASRRRGATAPSCPVTALVDQFYAEVQAMGGGRWDTSSLIARLERK